MEQYIVHPEVDQDSEPYWQSLRDQTAKLQQCEKCGRFRFPPSPSCYYCGALEANWVEISGRGAVHTWAVIHHPIDKRLSEDVPFVIVLVDLEEGPRVSGRLVGCDSNVISIGMPVSFRYDEIDEEFTLLNFEPLL